MVTTEEQVIRARMVKAVVLFDSVYQVYFSSDVATCRFIRCSEYGRQAVEVR